MHAVVVLGSSPFLEGLDHYWTYGNRSILHISGALWANPLANCSGAVFNKHLLEDWFDWSYRHLSTKGPTNGTSKAQKKGTFCLLVHLA